MYSTRLGIEFDRITTQLKVTSLPEDSQRRSCHAQVKLEDAGFDWKILGPVPWVHLPIMQECISLGRRCS